MPCINLLNKRLAAIGQLNNANATVRTAAPSPYQLASLQTIDSRSHRSTGQQNLLSNRRDRQGSLVKQNLEHHKVAESKTLCCLRAPDVGTDRSIGSSQDQPEPRSRNCLLVCGHRVLSTPTI